MLELVDPEKTIPKDMYKSVFPDMRTRLGECQRQARAAGVPVVVVFEGWDAAGKGTIINRLTQALDPRGFKVNPTHKPTEEERLRPWMWRFWLDQPPRGSFGIFDRSWYTRVLDDRIEGAASKREWRRAYEDILEFERQLVEDGTVIVKFWLHIAKKEQKKRLKKIEKDPATAWRVNKEVWARHRDYAKWVDAVEEMLERTSLADAPWTIVEATSGKFVRVKVFETLIKAIEQELERRAADPPEVPRPMPKPEKSATRTNTILDRADLTLALDRKDYDKELDELQKRLFRLEHELYVARVPAVVLYEGWDAGGKGGNIRRLTQGLDPRGYEVVPVGPPTPDERARHFLWRFWRDVPKAGHITIFDRTWYGRVLVERVEGFCTEAEWRRAYREINEFERQLADYGTAMVKFWLHIDKDEQLRRFEARQNTPHKVWKITEDDWRNREKWDKYEVAVTDMLQRTSTTYAPWTVLEANCKLHARVKALRTVAETLEAALAKA